MTALSLLKNMDREFSRPFWFSSHSPFSNLSENFEASNATTKGDVEFSYDTNWDQKENVWMVTIETPGVKKENIKIDIENELLLVTAEKTSGLHLGKFEQRFSLPKTVDPEKIEAGFEDGVLTVRLPTIEKKSAKSIAIK